MRSVIFPNMEFHYLASGSNFGAEEDNRMVPFRFAMNDGYQRDTSCKVRQTLNTKCSNGKYLTCPPYGYRKAERTTDQLVPDENTAPVVKMIHIRPILPKHRYAVQCGVYHAAAEVPCGML